MRCWASPTELMCIILDTNAFSDYVNKTPDMQPVRRWLEGDKGAKPKGKLVYSPTPVIKREIHDHARFGRKLKTLLQAGRVKTVSSDLVSKEEKILGKIESDDPHVLALAIASGVRVLVSRDKKLGVDFKRLTRGSIYKYARHKRLLTNDLCP